MKQEFCGSTNSTLSKQPKKKSEIIKIINNSGCRCVLYYKKIAREMRRNGAALYYYSFVYSRTVKGFHPYWVSDWIKKNKIMQILLKKLEREDD